MTYKIQVAEPVQIQSIIELCEVCGLSKREITQLQKNIERTDYVILIALSGQEVVGFIEAQFIADEIHLYDVAVAPSHRQQGIGKALVEALVRTPYVAILLEVRESNLAARRLYEKCGFVVDGIRRDYYSAPVENAVLMSRKIS